MKNEAVAKRVENISLSSYPLT